MEKMNTKTEKVRQAIESKGWEMLSDQYSGYKQKISVKCPNGHVQNKTFQSIKNNKKCLKCFHKSGKAGKKTHDYEDVKKYIDSLTAKIFKYTESQFSYWGYSGKDYC